MNRLQCLICLSCLLVLSLSCQKDKNQDKKAEDPMEMTRQKLNSNYVDTLVLHPTVFSRQINCNGKLRAVAKSELSMMQAGTLQNIRVSNGSVVRKGDLLARTDTTEARRAYDKAFRQMQRAEVDLLDKLISLGYEKNDDSVPPAIMERAKISSGWLSAGEQLDDARHNLQKCSLYAPFSGRVANMDAKLHQNLNGPFCTLIDDSHFDVEFNILESEVSAVEVGQRVVVSPFVNQQKTYIGRVTEVNPLVDDKGQVKLRARIANERHELIEGMNVRIVVENDMQNMFVVPKDAVVQRDGYYVVFCYREGAAVWTYVDVVQANIGSFAITGNAYKQTRIQEGDIIITSGNLNLADGTPVIPKAPQPF